MEIDIIGKVCTTKNINLIKFKEVFFFFFFYNRVSGTVKTVWMLGNFNLNTTRPDINCV